MADQCRFFFGCRKKNLCFFLFTIKWNSFLLDFQEFFWTQLSLWIMYGFVSHFFLSPIGVLLFHSYNMYTAHWVCAFLTMKYSTLINVNTIFSLSLKEISYINISNRSNYLLKMVTHRKNWAVIPSAMLLLLKKESHIVCVCVCVQDSLSLCLLLLLPMLFFLFILNFIGLLCNLCAMRVKQAQHNEREKWNNPSKSNALT